MDYLEKKTPQFYDGTTSTASLLVTCQGVTGLTRLVCTAGKLFSRSKTVQDYFRNTPQLDAATIGGNNPLIVFFRPGVIDTKPSDGKTVANEALLFHEALHGFTALGDGSIEIDLLGNSTDYSDVIDTYLLKNVLNVCGGI